MEFLTLSGDGVLIPRPDHPGSVEESFTSVTVIYDGGCPLCSREITHYRRRRGADRVVWVDGRQDLETLERLQISQAEAMRRFHVRDRAGQWSTGAAAFVLLWSQLGGYRWLARSVKMLRLLPLMEKTYTLFLAWRNRRSCDASVCGSPTDDMTSRR